MRRLVLVRHGESVWNAERRIQGQRCAGLSQLGHAQAAATAAVLAADHPDARLVTSDLQRTRETVAPLEAALGRSADVDARLRERSFGAWEGHLRDEVAKANPDRWRRWLDGQDVVTEVGGESAADLGIRAEAVLRELLETTPDGGVTIAVTHGGPVWQGIHELLDLPVGSLAGVDNASLHELVDHDGHVALDRWNAVGHLAPELRNRWMPSDPALVSDAPPVPDAPPVGR